MSPSGNILLHSTTSLLSIKPHFIEHLLPHILEPTVFDGLLHCTLETSSAIKIPVPWYSYDYYNSNTITEHFTL
jgi:hypothetical protein